MVEKLTEKEFKIKLRKAYYSKTNKEVCRQFNITAPTLSKYVGHFKFKRKKQGNFSNKDKCKFKVK